MLSNNYAHENSLCQKPYLYDNLLILIDIDNNSVFQYHKQGFQTLLC